jgi:fibronectin-binding autotransporter adhesin
MTTSGPVTFGSLSVLNYELNGGNTAIGGGINDLLTGVTNLTLGGTLNVLESPTTSFLGATEGNMWRLMNYSGTLNGALAMGTTPTLTPGLYLALDTATPNQVNLVVVPETGAVSLLGLATLFTLRRRRNVA